VSTVVPAGRFRRRSQGIGFTISDPVFSSLERLRAPLAGAFLNKPIVPFSVRLALLPPNFFLHLRREKESSGSPNLFASFRQSVPRRSILSLNFPVFFSAVRTSLSGGLSERPVRPPNEDQSPQRNFYFSPPFAREIPFRRLSRIFFFFLQIAPSPQVDFHLSRRSIVCSRSHSRCRCRCNLPLVSFPSPFLPFSSPLSSSFPAGGFLRGKHF